MALNKWSKIGIGIGYVVGFSNSFHPSLCFNRGNRDHQIILKKIGTIFKTLFIKCDFMEMRNEKRRRKIVQKTPVLVRSVRANQTSTLVWERENTINQLWNKFKRAS
jgi:hypothetical protein